MSRRIARWLLPATVALLAGCYDFASLTAMDSAATSDGSANDGSANDATVGPDDLTVVPPKPDLVALPDLVSRDGALDFAVVDFKVPDFAGDFGVPDFATDFAVPDFATRDFTVPDFALPDLQRPDLTTVPDKASPADQAPTCPMPPSTATFDPSQLSCSELVAEYAAAVDAAKTCGCVADCSEMVCDSFCCNCSTFVNPGSDAYPKLIKIQSEWSQRVNNGACQMMACTDVICLTPILLGCGSTGGRSVCISQ